MAGMVPGATQQWEIPAVVDLLLPYKYGALREKRRRQWRWLVFF